MKVGEQSSAWEISRKLQSEAYITDVVYMI
jgi:hypothetical protein